MIASYHKTPFELSFEDSEHEFSTISLFPASYFLTQSLPRCLSQIDATKTRFQNFPAQTLARNLGIIYGVVPNRTAFLVTNVRLLCNEQRLSVAYYAMYAGIFIETVFRLVPNLLLGLMLGHFRRRVVTAPPKDNISKHISRWFF